MSERFLPRLILLSLAAALVAAVWRAAPIVATALLTPPPAPRLVEARGDLAAAEAATIALFEAARDSVVFISTEEHHVDPWARNAVDLRRGTGSGFVWDGQGHVVTNNHVIEGADRATVRLADGRAFPARLVGTDPTHDLAVLAIDVDGPAPAALPVGSSADLKVGQTVFAIGNPFGLDWTLTQGIVSALDRELSEGEGRVIRGLIQTDAAINPGNSGGPLVDSAGRLIGVATAIYSPSGSNAGIGFAVPVDVVNRVVPQIIAHGRYTPPSIGLSVDARADAILARVGRSGAMVVGVDPGGPAERAGIRPARALPGGRIALGDVIVALDGAEVRGADDLTWRLDGRQPGETVTLTVETDGRSRDVALPVAGR